MSDYAPEFKVGDLVIKAGERIAELEAQLAAAQAEITRLRSGGCAREMSDALTKLMNLPVTGFDANGEETVNREAAAEIVQESQVKYAALIQALEAQLAAAQEINANNVANADLQFAEMQAEITRLCKQFRREDGCAGEMQLSFIVFFLLFDGYY